MIRDAGSGELVRQERASHPEGTEVHREHWWSALGEVITLAGGLKDVSAL